LKLAIIFLLLLLLHGSIAMMLYFFLTILFFTMFIFLGLGFWKDESFFQSIFSSWKKRNIEIVAYCDFFSYFIAIKYIIYNWRVCGLVLVTIFWLVKIKIDWKLCTFHQCVNLNACYFVEKIYTIFYVMCCGSKVDRAVMDTIQNWFRMQEKKSFFYRKQFC